MGSLGWAIDWLREGKRIARQGWNGKGMYLVLIPGKPSSAGDMDLLPWQEFVAMKTADDTVVPWLCSQTDLLATDWVVIDD